MLSVTRDKISSLIGSKSIRPKSDTLHRQTCKQSKRFGLGPWEISTVSLKRDLLFIDLTIILTRIVAVLQPFDRQTFSYFAVHQDLFVLFERLA